MSPRNPIGAALLSLLLPGLGQLYNGQPRKAYQVWAGGIAILMVATLVKLPTTFWGMVLLWIAGLALYVVAAVDAVRTAKASPEYVLKRFNRWFVYAGLFLAVLIVTQVLDTRTLLGVRAFRTPSEGMEPGLYFNDYFMTRLVTGESYIDNRGDILVFLYPADRQTFYLKRVVGFPGEAIEIADGRLFVDGQLVESPWADYAGHDPRASTINWGPVEAPPNTLVMLGDNLANSADSRAWGPLERELLVGVALYIYYSPDKSRIGKSLRVAE
jgi:signal peptidase I